MKVKAVSTTYLYNFLKKSLRQGSFSLYAHILTNPYISLLCDLPEIVKATSRIYLDEEKSKLNDYAIRNLKKCGYNNIYYVRRLHGKLLVTSDFIVVGSANYSERSLTNYETVFIIFGSPYKVEGLAEVLSSINSRAVKV